MVVHEIGLTSADHSYHYIHTLVITDITADVFKITATARMMDIGNKSFPSESYTAKNYVGLTR